MWQMLKNCYHLLSAILANIAYGFPGKKLTVIGVTGTDGKTTTTSLIYHILVSNGYPSSLISTVSAIIHGKSYDTGFHVTNPSPFPLQRFLSQTVSLGDTYLVLEVTSHGLDQNRVWGIPFAIGVLTNVSHEHLDYHKTYENYVKTKTKLLNMAKMAIINSDDSSYPLVKKFLRNTHVLTYSLKNSEKKFNPSSNFFGQYNTYNAYAAYLTCIQLGLTKKQIESALKTFVFPKGRGEIVYQKNFSIMIDFAHTPHAFEMLLSYLRSHTKGKLIHVFGCAGARDRSKRPLMGQIASLYDDTIILTSEDPRNENIQNIFSDIESGIKQKKGQEIFHIPNRKQAIEKAISLAKSGDYVVLTGKGHEQSINYGNGEEPWDEFSVVSDAVKIYEKK